MGNPVLRSRSARWATHTHTLSLSLPPRECETREQEKERKKKRNICTCVVSHSLLGFTYPGGQNTHVVKANWGHPGEFRNGPPLRKADAGPAATKTAKSARMTPDLDAIIM